MRCYVFALVSTLFILIPHSRAKRSRKVFAHYLPWYDASGIQFSERTGWCYSHSGEDCTDVNVKHYTNTPLLGEYSIMDDDVLEFQLLQMFVTGIDGVIINLNPESLIQKAGAVLLLERIVSLKQSHSAFDMKFIISYDSSNADQSVILSYMTWVYTTFYASETFAPLVFHDDETGRAVFITWSESDPAYYYSTIRSLFSNNVLLIIRNTVNFDVSDGNMEWVDPMNTAPPKTNTANYGQGGFDHIDWNMAHQSSEHNISPESVNTILLGNVYPGFDDVNVPPFWNGGNNRYFFRNVNDGETIDLLWQRHINYVPQRLHGPDVVDNPWIQLVTWNDWPEGTSIEPATSDTYGYRPLEVCHRRIPEYKGMSTPRFNANFLTVPYYIYQLRKGSEPSQADTLLTSLMTNVNSDSANGNGDPHFVGFDNSKFDFHGVHGQNYVVYARKDSDVLVAKVRAIPELYYGVNKTYFHQFGIQPAETTYHVNLFLKMRAAGSRLQWFLQCTINDTPCGAKLVVKGLHLERHGEDRIRVVTLHHVFNIKAISLSSKYRHHLDFGISLRQKERKQLVSHRYTGVLGMTLNRKLGSKVHQELMNSTGYTGLKFEMAMRRYYNIERLFPMRRDLNALFENQ